MKSWQFQVDEAHHGGRLDIVAAALGGDQLSRRRVRAMIDAGGAWVNGRRIRIASRTVRQGDRILLEADQRADPRAAARRMRLRDEQILATGEGYLVVDKPAGVPSQETRSQSHLHMKALVEAWLREKGKPPRVWLVHRLDQDTSGVMLFATTPAMAEHFTTDFRERRVEKIYHALCYGRPQRRTFEVDRRLSPVGRDGFVRTVHEGGRSAFTGFRLEREFDGGAFSLMECRPRTGRTHQIRVHLEHAGIPIVGDRKYGHRYRRNMPVAFTPPGRHLLHATRLRFFLPEGERIIAEAPLPAEFCPADASRAEVPIDPGQAH